MIGEFHLLALLNDFELKVARMSELYDGVRQRVLELEKEKADLQKTVQEQESQLKKKGDDLPINLALSKDLSKIVGDNLTESVKSAELKQKLDEYIREIDRCIAHLSNLS